MLGIYCRSSRRESICGVETVEQQREAGEKFATTNNLDYQIYEDSGKSGYIEKSKEDPFVNRPAFKQLLADIESGKINEIWVWELSRLARRNKYYAAVIDTLAERQITITVLNTRIDLTDTMQRAMVEMQGVWAQVERQEIVARTSRGRNASTDRGELKHGSMYGYETEPKTKITTPVISELEIVGGIYTDYLSGITLREIGKKYFITGTPETTKLLSVTKKVSGILSHEEYTGQNLKISGRKIESDFENGKIKDLQELYKDEFWVDSKTYKEKIIDRETWIKAKEKLEYTRRTLSANRNKGKRETNRSLASGMFYCSVCNNPYYYKDVGQKHGGIIYQHLRTVDKCLQKPSQIKVEKVDIIIDVLFTFFYLMFDDTGERLRENKLIAKNSKKEIKAAIADLESKRKTKLDFISKTEKNVATGIFDNEPDVFLETMRSLALVRKEAENFETQINLKNIELEEVIAKENDLDINTKYHLTTIERLNKWFDLREKQSFTELRIMLRDVLIQSDLTTINDNYLVFGVDDPIQFFVFDLNYDYNIVYPFIEQLLNRKLNKNYTELEKLWIEANQEKIMAFGKKANAFIESRPDRKWKDSFGQIRYDELFNDESWLFIKDVFDLEWNNGGLYFNTSEETKLVNNTYYTTAEVAEMLNVPKSTLREWARKKTGPKTGKDSKGSTILIWTDQDIENYKNRPKRVGNKGYKFTPEQLAHLSEVRKGKKQSEETKRKKAESMKKIWAELTPEEKEKRKSGLDPYNKIKK